MNMRRFLCILLFALLLASAIPVSAESQSEWTSSLDDKGTLTISGKGTIEESLFCWRDDIISVSIPNSVKMELGVFQSCKNLKSAVFENGTTSISQLTFYKCSSLSNVIIPDSVTEIGDDAFSDCSSLNSISLPPRLKRLSNWMLANCESLQSIEIPNSVTSIGIGVFYGCNSLKTITIPDSVKSIDIRAFESCKNLEKLIIPKSVTTIGQPKGYVCSGSDKVTIYGYTGSEAEKHAKEHDIPFVALDKQSGKKTGDYEEETDSGKKEKQFKINKGGMSVTYEDSDGKTKTKSVNIKKIVGKVKNLIIPAFVTHNGERCPVVGIANGACKNNKAVRTVTISNSIKSIGDEVFKGCSNLVKVTIPSSVNKIGKSVFQNNNKLKSIIIKTTKLSSKNIGKNAFKGINKKAVIKVPKKKKKAYKKLFRKKGLSKKAKVK